MNRLDYLKLIKLEDKIHRIAVEELNLVCDPIEFDVVPPIKMIEIMAYRSPSNISNWKFGRDMEKLRTIYERIDPGLPYEVVINCLPARAYLMNTNTLTVQCLVMAHVYGHVAFFTMNKWFQNSRKDILTLLSEANKRFQMYEKRFGIDEVEKIVDIGHALQLHCDPFSNETENEKRERIFEQKKLENRVSSSEFSDITSYKEDKVKEDIEMHNQRLWRQLKNTTPIEPTEDILRYIIDNSSILEDWQRDILEVLREEGIYFWPIIKTKYMNEGFATWIHEKIMNKLFRDGDLSTNTHGEFTYSNSLVKAQHKTHMNPYLIGSKMWEDIEDRWNKGKYGSDWEECYNLKKRKEWDKKKGKGEEKILNVIKGYTDWFFMHDFLTAELVDNSDLYLYQPVDKGNVIEYVRTNHSAEDVKKIIVNSFAHSGIPKIEVVNGNFNNNGIFRCEHRFSGVELNLEYAEKTMNHIYNAWGKPVILITKKGNQDVTITSDKDGVRVSIGVTPNTKPPEFYV